MNIIEQIKAEIEKRVDILATVSVKQAKNGDSEMSTYYHGKAVSLEELISFLSTLESEKPMNQEELDEEIDRLWESFADEMEGPHNLFDIYARLARHFAQWGAEHLKK